jgi:hypothetical protein
MRSSSGQKLQRAVEKDAALIDALTDSFADELSVVLDLLKTKIRGLVKKIQADPNGRMVATQQNLALALRLRADLIRVLDDAGYTQLALKATDAPLDRLAAQVLKGGVEAVRLGAYDLDALVAMKEIRFAQILKVGEDIAANLWRVTLDGVLGARPVTDLVDDISDLLDTSAKQARTLYDTMTSTFSRQVGQIGTTGEPDEAFLYVGPDDIKTRDFCAERVDKVFSREEIEDWDNGNMDGDPFLVCGGWNCRHQLRRVSAIDSELLDLMDTDTPYQDRDSVAA